MVENQAPIRVERYELVADSGGDHMVRRLME